MLRIYVSHTKYSYLLRIVLETNSIRARVESNSCPLMTTYIFFTASRPSRPPLWSSGHSSWLQIRRPGFDSRHYQKKKVVGLERGPLSIVSTTGELLDRKVVAPVYKTENTALGIRHADHVAPSIHKSCKSLLRQAAVARSV
jgi:hypothetical protein